MDPFFTFFPLSLSILLFSLIIPSGFGSPDWYTSCSSNFVCGSINIGYPFWGSNRVYGCGVPGLELKCQNDTTLIEINKISYQVVGTDENAQTLKIARKDYQNGICQADFVNTTLDLDVFEYVSGYSNLTIFYGCPLDGVLGPLSVFSCTVSGSSFQSGFATWEVNGPGLCYTSVYVPVSVANFGTAVFSSSTLEESLKQGFEVKWRDDDATVCTNCIRSKGVCGYGSNRTTCYCPGQILGSEACAPSSSGTDSVPGMFLLTSLLFLK
ncbi:Protein kinase superfamily protein [Euphorbia peplus]|nr:Protein kinase superfamily protein [Euphorbia peplus]